MEAKSGDQMRVGEPVGYGYAPPGADELAPTAEQVPAHDWIIDLKLMLAMRRQQCFL